MVTKALMRTAPIGVLILFTTFSQAEVYKWVDEDGQVHFSDSKPETTTEVETVTPTIQKPSSQPDEGELRRLEYLNTPPPKPITQSEEATESTLDATKCRRARVEYGILQEEMSIYFTESGRLRAHWTNDYYRGERNYISDEDRPSLEDKVVDDLYRYCEDPQDDEAYQTVYNEFVDSEWCEVHKIALQAANDPASRTADHHKERLTRLIADTCKHR